MKFLTMGIIFAVISFYTYDHYTPNDSGLIKCNNSILENPSITRTVNCAIGYVYWYNFVIFGLIAAICFIKCRPRTYGKKKVMKFD